MPHHFPPSHGPNAPTLTVDLHVGAMRPVGAVFGHGTVVHRGVIQMNVLERHRATEFAGYGFASNRDAF